ncbi:ABC transporter ATP-binding protein [Erysipelothrix rhusiopathiae]|uniref:ATP-binding cassette domain-containing protein n=1 Tax=Erysipelothrix rhusiopathiae TaxID=1648 RepID=UPI0023B0E34A|nr:ABC transporter ATP-binding protein [Erysipelothrix rhusiopathiae]MDE8341943.1 ABC transporter ATP-binding protein [Erysipelothrix rhusiopathiae]
MLILENIKKSYKDLTVLENLNLELNDHSIIYIKGKNGCGKSTLLKIISGILKADGGSIKTNYKNIGALIENPSFIEDQTLIKNLKFLFNIKSNFNYEYVKELADAFDLEIDSKIKMKNYSVGMRQKAGLIQAIMEDQDLILLDEPTRGLDDESILSFTNIISNMKAKTIIICSHDEIEDINFDKKFELVNGKLEKI